MKIGEFCNVPTGTCIQDPIDRCSLCNAEEIYIDQPTDGVCLYTDESNGCTIDIYLNQMGCSLDEVCFPDDIDALLLQVVSTTQLLWQVLA